MKKLILLASLILCAPIVMADTMPNDAQTTNVPNAAGVSNLGAGPMGQQAQHIQFLTLQGPQVNSQAPNLNWARSYGPLSVGSIYDSVYGWLFNGQYTQALGDNNALSLMLDGGSKEKRANLTWGVALTPQQRLKLTGEYLTQDIDFSYASGKSRNWQGQQAYGATYEYLMPKGFVNDININTFYSRASSDNLDTTSYSANGLNYWDYRRIAGGTDRSGSLGVDLLPTSMTLVGLQANYDNVIYDTKYENGQNVRGLGATVSLQQLITKHMKFQLLAAQRQPVKTYQGELDYLFHTHPGTQLQLALTGSRNIGKGQLITDNQIGLNADYSWGGTQNAEAVASSAAAQQKTVATNDAGYTLGAVSSQQDLSSWSAQPAVHMEQVLAVADEKLVLKTASSTKGLNLAACNQNMPFKGANTIPALTYPAGSVVNQDVGLLSSNDGSGAFFRAQDAYPVLRLAYSTDASASTNALPVPGTGLTLNAVSDGIAGFRLVVTGTVLPNAPSQVTLNLFGFNAYGACGSEAQQVVINLGPSFNPPTQYYYTGQNNTVDLSSYLQSPDRVTAIKIVPENGSNPLANYGISQTGAKDASLKVNPSASQYTTATQHYEVDNTSDNKKIGYLDIVVATPPVANSIPAQTVEASQAMTSVSAIAAYTDRSNSGGMEYAQPTVTAGGVTYSLADLGLQWSGNQLSSSALILPESLHGVMTTFTVTFSASNKYALNGAGQPVQVANPMQLTISPQVYTAGFYCPSPAEVASHLNDQNPNLSFNYTQNGVNYSFATGQTIPNGKNVEAFNDPTTSFFFAATAAAGFPATQCIYMVHTNGQYLQTAYNVVPQQVNIVSQVAIPSNLWVNSNICGGVNKYSQGSTLNSQDCSMNMNYTKAY